MKIAITALGADLQSQVDPRFGRAQYFIIIDPETMQFEAIENASVNAAHGAGIQSGQLMSQKDVSAIVTGSVGPNAHQTLTAAGIQIFQAFSGTVAQMIEAYKMGQLQPITQIGPAHAGTGGGLGNAMGPGMGRGMGGGGGMGGGQGRRRGGR
jgi:predicted Fe-Mo cluster-binding NifX family protein